MTGNIAATSPLSAVVSQKLLEARARGSEHRAYPLIVAEVLGRTWVLQRSDPDLEVALERFEQNRQRLLALLHDQGGTDDVGPVELEARLARGLITREDLWKEGTRLMLLASHALKENDHAQV